MLPKRDLGTTGMQVSCLGLGTVKFGRNRDVKYPKGFELPSDREITALLDLAREAGVNLLDTAPAYGSSEQRIGSLLKGRDDWLLCTKVGEIFEGGRSRFDFSAAHVRESIEQSLHHLRTDRLDLVLIHSDGNDLDILDKSDCLETLERMRREGLLRAIGMSSKTIEGGLRAIKLVDVLMLTYNRSDTSQKPVIDQAQEAGKGVLIKKGLASGHAVHGAVQEQTPSVAENFRFLLEPPRHLIDNRRNHKPQPPPRKHRGGKRRSSLATVSQSAGRINLGTQGTTSETTYSPSRSKTYERSVIVLVKLLEFGGHGSVFLQVTETPDQRMSGTRYIFGVTMIHFVRACMLSTALGLSIGAVAQHSEPATLRWSLEEFQATCIPLWTEEVTSSRSDCTVAEFGEIAILDGVQFYYARYHDRTHPHIVPNSIFTNTEFNAVVIIGMDPADGNEGFVAHIKKQTLEGEHVSFRAPRLIQTMHGPVLYLQGWGMGKSYNQYVRDDYLLWDSGTWEVMDVDGWFGSVEYVDLFEDVLPEGPMGDVWLIGLWDLSSSLSTMTYESALWLRDDAFCCPSGGSARFHFELIDRMLKVSRIEYFPEGEVPN